MKKYAPLWLVACVLTYAAISYAQNVASDKGGSDIINHNNGVMTFKIDKLNVTKCVANSDGGACLNVFGKAVNYFTTAALYPTKFTPETIVWDAGCQKHTLTMDTAISTGLTAGNPLHCIIDVPFQALDAGVFTVYRALDGGYGVSQCPANAAIPSTTWPAYCAIQNGRPPF